ncbi:MAG: hypothetical protein AAGA10_21220 [Bacteroidota bacterium]
MKFTLFTLGLVNFNTLGFLWVGDSFTYFEMVYLPVVILLMILATFFIRRKDHKLSRMTHIVPTPFASQEAQTSPSDNSVSFSIPENSNTRVVKNAASMDKNISSDDDPMGMPSKIPA